MGVGGIGGLVNIYGFQDTQMILRVERVSMKELSKTN